MKDKILVFEYFTASGQKDECIISEAEALIISLLNDLKNYDVDLLINESFKYIAEAYENVNPIVINENVIDYLEKNASNFDKAIFIAAENDNNLYRITKILEDADVFIYNSNSEAAFNTSDKFVMYELLEDVVYQPKTFKFKIDPKGYWKRAVENLYETWENETNEDNLSIIIKPVNGVDCEDIVILDDINDLSYDLEEIFPPGSRILVQEFIEGEDVSVSLIVKDKKAIPISLNKQFVSLDNNKAIYLGGELPYNCKSKNEAIIMAINACQYLDGLKGFVGVDLRITPEGEVYLLEINSRFTTPYVGLQKIAISDIAEDIINLVDDDIDLKDKIQLSGSVKFEKVKDNLVIEEFKQ